jgi:hypothetical protein
MRLHSITASCQETSAGALAGAGYEDVFVAIFGPDFPYDISTLSKEGSFIIFVLLVVLASCGCGGGRGSKS